MPKPQIAAGYATASITAPEANVGLGLFFDRPLWQIPPGGLSACNNVRVFNQKLTSFSMGWSAFALTMPLNGPITLIDTFTFSTGITITIFGTPTDLYQYTPTLNPNVEFITPTYSTGTVSINNGSPTLTGAGTAWKTGTYPIKPGDQVFLGTANYVTITGPWYTVLTVNSDTSITLKTNYSGTNLSGSAYTIRQLFRGDAQNNVWSGEMFPNANYNNTTQDVWMAVNGVDFPFAWNGTNPSGDYRNDLPFVAKSIFRFKNLMCYAGLLSSGGALQPTGFANSDNGSPVIVNGSGVSGQYTVTDDPTAVTNMGALGNTLMLYSPAEAIAAMFVGPPTNWIFSKVIQTRGLIAPRALAQFPDRHQFLGQDGEYRYNGLFVQLMNTQVWRSILQTFDVSRAGRAVSIVSEQFGDIIWALPFTSDNSPPGLQSAFVEHYLEMPQSYLQKPITKRDFPFTCAGQFIQQSTQTWQQLTQEWPNYQAAWNSNVIVGSFPLLLAGDINGNVWVLYSADTQAGTGYTSTATFGQRLVANERSRGLVRRIYAGITQNQSAYPITIALTMFDEIGGAATFTDTKTLPSDYSAGRFTSHFRRGRVGAVTFSTPGPNQPWELNAWDWDAVPGGLR